jgi:hypothetical protein
VAPTIGTRPRNPTATASTAAYGIPTIDIMIHAQNALTAATTTCPIAYEPTRRMISSESEITRGRRLAGHDRIRRLLERRQGREEVEGQDQDGQRREDPLGDDPPGPEHAAGDLRHEVAVGEPLVDLLLDLVDHVVVLVDVLDAGVAEHVVDVARCALGELAGLLRHRRHHDEPQQHERADGQANTAGHRPSRAAAHDGPRSSTTGLRARVRKKATVSRVSTCPSDETGLPEAHTRRAPRSRRRSRR